MPYDEPADLIGSAEATLDVIALLLGDISEEVDDTARHLEHRRDPQPPIGRGRQVLRQGPAPAPRASTSDEGDARCRCHQAHCVAGLEALLRAQAAAHPAAALAPAGRMAAVRHAEPD